jgi:phosphopantetheinyl transferase
LRRFSCKPAAEPAPESRRRRLTIPVGKVNDGSERFTVWCRATGGLEPDALVAEAGVLCPAERARSARFVFPADRREFVAAHALLRCALSRRRPAIEPAAWRFEPGPLGKPRVAPDQRGDPPVTFNLSHTRGLVACVVADGRAVGVDVESADRPAQHDALAARFFHASEIESLRALGGESRRVRFVELWTLKEAYLKAIGAGLSMPLRDCRFDLRDDGAIDFTAGGTQGASGWHFALFAVADRFRLAVAWAGEPPGGPGIRIIDGDYVLKARCRCCSA